MRGKMLWFNADKDFGFIRTEEGERLYVARDAFLPADVPTGRCAGQEVSFQRQLTPEGSCAVNVRFEVQTEARRARRRQRGAVSR